MLTAHRHWNVFAAGTALVLIAWVITPLQSSLLTIQFMTQEVRTQFIHTARLGSYSSQAGDLDSSFLYFSYGVTWLGEEIEVFMTREFAAMPFIAYNVYEVTESWTAVTRVYQTYLDCAPATIIEPGENDHGAYNFTTDDCSYSFNPLPNETATRNLIYIGYGHNGNNNSTPQWYLREPECKVKNIFLGVWAKSLLPSTRSRDIEVSGIFCHTKYSYSDANITVNAAGWGITNFSFIGEPKPLTAEDGIFDIDIFEQYIGAGSTRESGDESPLPTVAPATQVRYEDWELWHPTVLVGYAIGLEDRKFGDFRDPEVFGEAMNKTHKLLFTYAVRNLLNYTEDDELRKPYVNGTRIVRSEGVVVVPAVAHLLAGFLSAVAVCLASVLLLSYNRRSNLRSDPDTLATTMSLVARSPWFLKDIEGADDCPDISRCIRRRRYILGPWDGKDGPRLDIVDTKDATPSGGSHEASTKPHDGRGIRPWELSFGMTAGTTIFSIGLLVFLAALFRSNQKYSGQGPHSFFRIF